MIQTFPIRRCIGRVSDACKAAGGLTFAVAPWQPWRGAGYCLRCAEILAPELIVRSVPAPPARR